MSKPKRMREWKAWAAVDRDGQSSGLQAGQAEGQVMSPTHAQVKRVALAAMRAHWHPDPPPAWNRLSRVFQDDWLSQAAHSIAEWQRVSTPKRRKP